MPCCCHHHCHAPWPYWDWPESHPPAPRRYAPLRRDAYTQQLEEERDLLMQRLLVNPNNPNGGTCDMTPFPDLLRHYPETYFLVDEAFIDLGGQSVVSLVPQYANLLVTRTLSKAHSLAGFRVGYAVLPEPLADDLNAHNDAYPLATLAQREKITQRAQLLKDWTRTLACELEQMGVTTYPTETYFFLVDLTPYSGKTIADALAAASILVKPLEVPRLGAGFIRMTTAVPEDNAKVLRVLRHFFKEHSR